MIFNPHKYGLHKILHPLHTPLSKILDTRHSASLQRAVNIADLRGIAKQRAHKMVFDYLDGGADDEITLRRNKDAFSQLEMHYKVLAGIKPPLDLSTTIMGVPVKIPFFTCPTAGNKMFHYKGEMAAAKVAHENGALYSLSSLSTTSFDDIQQAYPGPKIFQLYVWRDRAIVKDILVEAKAAGFQGLALTADVSWMGNRERDPRNGFTVPPTYSLHQTLHAIQRPAWTFDFLAHEPFAYACINKDVPAESMASFINGQLCPDFSWKDAEWLLGEWGDHGATALKGVIRPEDAVEAIKSGFTTLWISNHGGRQLETSPATIDVLPKIRQAVGTEAEIILDGGIQRGTDIAKALALGADGVGIGKPYLWGLAAGGEAGVAKVFEILRIELDRAMGLLGTPTVADLKKEGCSLVQRREASIRDYPDQYAYDRGYGGGVI